MPPRKEAKPIQSLTERRENPPPAAVPEHPEAAAGEPPAAERPARRRYRRFREPDRGLLSCRFLLTADSFYTLRQAAEERDQYMYDIVQEALFDWLRSHNYLVGVNR